MSATGPTLPLLAYIGAATLLTVTPGVDTALVLRAATRLGPRPAALAAVGVAGGCLVWGALVALGLGTVLQASPAAFAALRLIGAAYLLWLGLGLLVRPRHTFGAGQSAEAGASPPWRQGLLTNLLNPKVGLFYLTFLPQFLPAGSHTGGAAMALVAIHIALSLVWFAVLIGATVPLARLLARPAVIAAMDRACGIVFVGFAIKLAL